MKIYILSTGGNQYTYQTRRLKLPYEVFAAVLPEIEKNPKRKLGVLYSVQGGHLEETVYCDTIAALKLAGREVR